MSTLSTANIESKAANTPPVIKDLNGTEVGQFARAWVNFNGTGTVAIRDSFNVSSITDQSTGLYTVNFTNAMPNANYAYSLNSQTGATAGTTTTLNSTIDSLSTTNMEVASFSNSSYEDHTYYSVIVFGG